MSNYRLQSLLGRTLCAGDGEVGTIYDVYFSDDKWRVEHLVVEIGAFLNKRKVIIDPRLLLSESDDADAPQKGKLQVAVNCDDIAAAPDASTDRPVSEQKATEPHLHPYFLWFPTGDSKKIVLRPMGARPEDFAISEERALARGDNPHLQSFREVKGYSVIAADNTEEEKINEGGDHVIGHVADMVANSNDWSISQLIIEMPHAKSKQPVAVEPQSVDHIDWADVHVYLLMSRADLGLPKSA